MSSLGMHILDFEVVGDEQAACLWFQLEHVYPLVRFIEYLELETDLNMDLDVRHGGWVGIALLDLSRVKRIIARIAKERGIDDDVEWDEAEAMAALNKLSNIVLYDLGLDNIEFEECTCPTGLRASVSPDNLYKLKVLAALLPHLLPRELGGAEIKFENSSGSLMFGRMD